MALKNKFIEDKSGGVIIFVAVSFTVLLSVLGLTLDLGRIYAVQSKAQQAADAALMGGVATLSSTNMANEAVRLFNANYPAGYMGSTVGTPVVTVISGGQYKLTIPVTVPLSIMQIFGASASSINITSQVSSGYQLGAPQSLELSLVFDNAQVSDTASMASAGNSLANVIFGGSPSLSNVHVHVVPFDAAVNVGNHAWVQTAFTARYNQYRALSGGTNAYFANRNNDNPPNALVDVSDVAPTTNTTRFRVPFFYSAGAPRNPTNDPDYVSTNKLSQMGFGLNTTAAISSSLNAMQATGGNHRINVGLMWGWFALSPNWQGLFSAGLPGLPAATNPLVSKQMVLVVTGQNNVYTGQPLKSNDDTTTSQLCLSVRAKGIHIYTVGYGAPGSYNATMLQNCATSPNHFFAVSNGAQLVTAFNSIADDIQSSTLRVSQ